MTVAQLPTFKKIGIAVFSNNLSQRLLEQSADFMWWRYLLDQSLEKLMRLLYFCLKVENMSVSYLALKRLRTAKPL